MYRRQLPKDGFFVNKIRGSSPTEFMFPSATSQRQIAVVNQSSRFTSHAYKKNAIVACVQNRGILFAQCSIYFVSESTGKGGGGGGDSGVGLEVRTAFVVILV